MSDLSVLFAQLRDSGRTAFCPYLTVGFPNVPLSIEMAAAASRAGANVVEVGVPFSDPLADGPTIQAASQTALDGGVDVEDAFRVVRSVRAAGDAIPVLMTYFNPVHRMGLVRFVERAADAGAAGLIVPDLPLEEGAHLRAIARERGLDVISLIAPTTPDERVARISKESSGFLYLVAVTGVTGAREQLGEGIRDYVARVRVQTDLPLCVGFGISTPEHARVVADVADGIIVGSALVDRVREDPERAPAIIEAAVEEFLGELV